MYQTHRQTDRQTDRQTGALSIPGITVTLVIQITFDYTVTITLNWYIIVMLSKMVFRSMNLVAFLNWTFCLSNP